TLLRHAEGTDFIAHTAAQPAMTISWENPRLDLETNVVGTFNVLEAARACPLPGAQLSHNPHVRHRHQRRDSRGRYAVRARTCGHSRVATDADRPADAAARVEVRGRGVRADLR